MATKRTNERGCTSCNCNKKCVIPDEGVKTCALRHKDSCRCTPCTRRKRGGGTVKGGYSFGS